MPLGEQLRGKQEETINSPIYGPTCSATGWSKKENPLLVSIFYILQIYTYIQKDLQELFQNGCQIWTTLYAHFLFVSGDQIGQNLLFNKCAMRMLDVVIPLTAGIS